MKLSDEQYEFIKGEVTALFERYNVQGIPINGFELAYKMGIVLVPYSSLNDNKHKAAMKASPDGFYMEDIQGRDIIYYNDEGSYERMNMTILHEIGHCVLDHQNGSEEEEAEAKFFAKYALVPPVLVHKLKLTTPEEISETFDVSFEAAYYALVYYNKWLRYSGKYYKSYVEQLLALFNNNNSKLKFELN